MGLFDTDATEVGSGLLKKALEELDDLQEWLNTMAIGMKLKIDKPSSSFGDGFPKDWCDGMMERALRVYNDVARCNGAALVRGTEKKEGE